MASRAVEEKEPSDDRPYREREPADTTPVPAPEEREAPAGWRFPVWLVSGGIAVAAIIALSYLRPSGKETVRELAVPRPIVRASSVDTTPGLTSIPADELSPPPAPRPAREPAGGEPSSPAPVEAIYEVQDGDTLWSIAARTTGNPYDWARIAKVNELSDPDMILPGQQIRVPKAE